MNIDFKFVLRALLVVVALVAIYLLASHFLKGVFSPDDLLNVIKDSGPWAPLVYIGLFILSPGIPASGLAIASGAIFGLWSGFLLTMAALLLALIPPFLIARLLGRKLLNRLLSKVGGSVEDKVEKFQQGVEKNGWRYIAFCRLIPFLPFSLLNLLFGLTRINFWTYLLVSFVFSIPEMFAWAYIGHAGAQAAGGAGIWLYVKVFLALGSLIGLAFLPQIIKFVRNRWGKK